MRQVLAHLRWIVAIAMIVALAGAFVVVMYITTEVPLDWLLDDPAEVAMLPDYSGIVSNAGAFIMWAGAVVAGTAVAFGTFESPEHRRFARGVAILCGFLAIDDKFLVHEQLGLAFARLTTVDDPYTIRARMEIVVFAIYVLIAGVWALRNVRRIFALAWPLFAIGVVGFALSILVDLLPSFIDSYYARVELKWRTTIMVAEELLKLAGIGGSTAFAIETAKTGFRPHQTSAADSPH